MKAVKFIFAFSLFFMAFTSCTSDDLADDQSLYTQDTDNYQDALFTTGEDGTATVDNSRE
ncbi:MAG: hypothetical protein QM495_06600 [Lutibacter sp.]|uniref:hypothetical protein n=1 Tax=Lutibacter sp. TaxID=1925666 RepID=UPI0038591F6B